MDLIWLLAGIVPLGAGAYGAARFLLGTREGAPRTLATCILSWAALTLGVEGLGTCGWLNRPALVTWSAVVGILGVGLGLRQRRVEPIDLATIEVARRDRLDWSAVVATILVAWTALRTGLVAFAQPVKVVSDGPIYHLYFAARWWQAGRIEPVASPFGEAGATYFWANGELVYTWLMTLDGGDRFARMGQVPFYLICGGASAALARALGTSASGARVAATWLASLGPLLLFGFEPNVDAILVAGYLLTAFFFVRAFAAQEPVDPGSLLLGALAAGLGMGTKPTGIVFFPPLIALATLGVIVREVRAGRGARALVLGGAVPLTSLAMMAYWPVRNALWTGNPLYPLHVALGDRVFLAGWFGPEAMKQSPYYIAPSNVRALGDILVSVVDGRLAWVWAAAALGAWAIRWRRPRCRSAASEPPGAKPGGAGADRWVVALTVLGLLDLAAYWLVIPYRTQQRFCLPGFALLTIPLARLLDRSRWLVRGGLALLALHLLTPEAWPVGVVDRAIPWDLDPRVINAHPAFLLLPTSLASFSAPDAARRFLATALLGLGALGAVWLWDSAGRGVAGQPGGMRRFGRRLTALALLTPLAGGASWALRAFDAMPFPNFPEFYYGWGALEQLAGPDGARVAYAGNKIPYYLMGSRLQNRVCYVNVDEHRTWLMHDYHRHAPEVGQPATWPNPFPGWDRLRPNYAAWLANLRAERIRFLVVTRANAEEGGQNFDTERFPIERTWADRHPTDFRPLFGPGLPGVQIRIYEVLPAAILQESSTDRPARSH